MDKNVKPKQVCVPTLAHKEVVHNVRQVVRKSLVTLEALEFMNERIDNSINIASAKLDDFEDSLRDLEGVVGYLSKIKKTRYLLRNRIVLNTLVKNCLEIDTVPVIWFTRINEDLVAAPILYGFVQVTDEAAPQPIRVEIHIEPETLAGSMDVIYLEDKVKDPKVLGSKTILFDADLVPIQTVEEIGDMFSELNDTLIEES